MKIRILATLTIVLAWSLTSEAQLFKKKPTAEKVTKQCEGLKLSERPRITVSRFDITARRAKREFGAEVAAMLSNALVGTNCFNVLAGAADMGDLTDEMKISQQMGGDSPEGSKIKSAQYFVTGQITEFEEIKHGTNTLGVNIGVYKAHIGFVISIKNAQREIIFSKSIDQTRSKPGTGGVTLFGFPIATASFSSKAMAEALERGILEAVEILVDQKDQLEMTAPAASQESIVYTAANCPVVSSGNAPRIMVIIPEEHIRLKIPDPAGETEIIKKFVNAGFDVVDPTMYMALRNDGNIKSIVKNPVEAAAIGAKHGADIIIIGEAFSQSAGNLNGMVSCRARVEARAIDTRTAVIVAADGKHGSGLDIAEMISAKTALRNAGSSIADSFLSRICNQGGQAGQNTFTARGVSATTSAGSIQMLIKGADYSSLSNVSKFLKSQTEVSDVTKKLVDGDGNIQFKTSGSVDDLLDKFMGQSIGSGFEVSEFTPTKIVLQKK